MQKNRSQTCIYAIFVVPLQPKYNTFGMKKLLIFCFSLLVTTALMAQHHHGPGHGPDRGPERGPQPRHVVVCATPEQMNMTMQVLEQQSFDDKKLEVAKLAVVLGHFCTKDLARIAETFSFDDQRLTFLLFAYDYCEDPQNYPALRDVFSFDSNYDKLIKTIYPSLR